MSSILLWMITLPRRITQVLLVGLCLAAFFPVVTRALFELQGSYHSDVAIFTAVSRGLLNGLRLYSDIFENKAPGIFLLGALSLKLFGDPRLLSWIQALTTVLFPFCLAAPVWYRSAGPERLFRTTLAWVTGCILSVFAAFSGGQVFIESYGAFFGALFLGFLFLTEGPFDSAQGRQSSRRVNILLALPLFGALGFKEPMALSILGGALILLPTWKATRRLLPPFVIVAIGGVILLTLFGFIAGYFTVYARHILGHHLQNPWGTTIHEPLWLRTIEIPRIADSLWDFSPVLPFFVGAIWIGSLVLLIRRAVTVTEKFSALGRWALATWLTTLPVGLTGDFYFHHFVFAVPGYCGFFFCCLRNWQGVPAKIRVVVALAFTALACATLLSVPWTYGSVRQWRQEWLQPRARAGAVLDSIMDRCKVERYVNLIDRPDGVYGFTKHSPYGPIFNQYSRFIGVMPLYLDSFTKALRGTELILGKHGEDIVPIDSATFTMVQEQFSTTPWPCAGPIQQPVPYRILFRKGAR